MQSIKKFLEQERSIPSRAALRYGSHVEHFKILIFLFDFNVFSNKLNQLNGESRFGTRHSVLFYFIYV